ncbi:hypothetical protein TNCV_2220981 [Trichonephila clavipes]|nr:hypothetical protein TNCV_2220981 [Trichonephila clavipes]
MIEGIAPPIEKCNQMLMPLSVGQKYSPIILLGSTSFLLFFLDINGKRVSVSIELDANLPLFLTPEDLQLPQTKNETPRSLWNRNATASTPCHCGNLDPTASTAYPAIYTPPGRKVHLPTRYR